MTSLPTAEARGLAGAYERVVFYYLYRMAVITWGKSQRHFFWDQTLPNGQVISCADRGTHSKGGCNIREFINFLNNAELDENFWADVDLENPDPHRVAGLLWEKGDQTGLLSTAKLFPGQSVRFENAITKMKNLMKESKYPPILEPSRYSR